MMPAQHDLCLAHFYIAFSAFPGSSPFLQLFLPPNLGYGAPLAPCLTSYSLPYSLLPSHFSPAATSSLAPLSFNSSLQALLPLPPPPPSWVETTLPAASARAKAYIIFYLASFSETQTPFSQCVPCFLSSAPRHCIGMESGIHKQGFAHENRRVIARKVVIRSLLFALVFTGLHFLYFLHYSSPYADGRSFLSRQVYQGIINFGDGFRPSAESGGYKFKAYEESVHLQLRQTLTPGLRKLWTSKEWRKKVNSFSLIFTELMKAKILQAGDKSLCIAAGAGQEVIALMEIGVNSLGIDLVASPPLVVQGDMHRLPFPADAFDFEFSNSFDLAMFSATVCSEMERTLKPGGFAVIHVSKKKLAEKLLFRDLPSVDRFTDLFKNSDIVHAKKVDAFGVAYEVVLRKRLHQGNDGRNSHVGKCTVTKQKEKLISEAEPLIMEEPLKPWITLKENAKKMKYLPTVTDISHNNRYFYVDVGARSYRSSIGNWFVKKYPKQNQDFLICAVEADDSFAGDYVKRRNVKLLPYAAWLRNESLVFGPNPENRAAEGEIGMGRIQSRSALQDLEGGGSILEAKQFRTVQGFDFAEWLMKTVTPDDFVVMKMDVEGAEFDLLPRMLETGAICLVDELFLECHYNRWQRSSPLRTSKYGKTFGECVSLFESLRSNGVLVHQWW